ncbi:hypothetical protein KR032_001321, partial [Drosophila birchii]
QCEVNMRRLFLSGLALLIAGFYFMDVFVDLMIYEERPQGNSSLVGRGCRMLTFTPDEDEVMALWGYPREDLCAGHLYFAAFSRDGNNYLKRQWIPEFLFLKFWTDSLLIFNCRYHAVERVSDNKNRLLYSQEFNLMVERITIKPIADIIRIECFLNRTYIYNGVQFYVRPPDKRLRSSLGLPPLRSVSDPESLSVLIVGLDSISQPHFGRTMPQTASFLRSLPHVELKGFHRLGRTFESLMPLLSGLSGSEVANFYSSLKRLDTCPFIWKEFRKAGYLTALGEDNVEKSLFPKQGFDEPPTDYYLRPALIEMWLKTRYDRSHGVHCNEKDNYAMVLREFFYKIIPQHQRHRFFTFLWWTQGIDHLFNYGRLLDVIFLEMFELAARSGLLKSTLLLVVSNHGLNKGHFFETAQGKVEENLPLALLCYPKTMEEKFPHAIANLRANNHRLVTAYDLYATLLDLPNLTSIKDESVEQRSQELMALGENLPRGLSLFLPVPSYRDCSSAEVPSKYCMCQQNIKGSITELYVFKAAILIVQTINKILSKHIPPCQKLSLKLVLAVDEWWGKTDSIYTEILVSLLTTPGEGQFEGVVRYMGHKLNLNGPILRTNEYGNDSYCIDNYLINKYCYCQ